MCALRGMVPTRYVAGDCVRESNVFDCVFWLRGCISLERVLAARECVFDCILIF